MNNQGCRQHKSFSHLHTEMVNPLRLTGVTLVECVASTSANAILIGKHFLWHGLEMMLLTWKTVVSAVTVRTSSLGAFPTNTILANYKHACTSNVYL